MHKNVMKCNKTLRKWCKNKHGASKIIDTFETYYDVNFIRNNNFNNSAYRNNFASNNYRSYSSTNGNGYGNSSNNTRGAPS
jgi:hypothetical protein